MYNFLDKEVRVLRYCCSNRTLNLVQQYVFSMLCFFFFALLTSEKTAEETLSQVTRYVTGPYQNTVRATMSANIDLRVYTGNNVLLPGSQVPRPATVLISTKSGKIIDVREGRHVTGKAEADNIADSHWTDIGDKYLLPGLVEYV